MRNSRLDNVISFIGRKNSGKTTLIEQVIAELTHRGVVVSSLKHHSHNDFAIDIAGKDSFRHHEAGTLATAIASETRFAVIEDLKSTNATEEEIDLTDVDALLRDPREQQGDAHEQCVRAIGMLPASNIVVIEGFKQAGLATIELFRSDNPRYVQAAPQFIDRLNAHVMNGGIATSEGAPLPSAVVTDMTEITAAALTADVPCFGFYDVAQIATWLADTFAKPLLSVVIQCGGESKRMKESKALVNFHGRPLIEHLVARLAPLAADLVITTNEPDKFRYLQVRYPGLRLVGDKYKKRGSLPGFITALEAARYSTVAVVACDLVNLSTDLLEYEADLLESSQQADLFIPYDAVVPMGALGYEPFCGVYHKERCLEAALASWDRKKVRVKHMLESLNIRIVDADDATLCPPGCFLNVNTPDELMAAQGLNTSL